MSAAETLESRYLGTAVALVAIVNSGGLESVVDRLAACIEASLPQLDVCVVTSDGVDLDAFAQPSTVALVLHDGDRDNLRRLNARLGTLEMPTLFAVREDEGWAIGPWFLRGHTACWQCAETTRRFFPRSPPASAHAECDKDGVARIVAALDSILQGESPLIDGVLEMGGGCEHVLKDPLCPVCSIWARRPIEALHVQHA